MRFFFGLSDLICRIYKLLVINISNSKQGAPVEIFLILGGSKRRELQCAKVLRQHNVHEYNRYVILSSGAANINEISDAANMNNSRRVYIDTRAVDTVTNFTTLAHDLHKCGFSSIAVVTSSAHMQRAYPVSRLIFNSLGMSVMPIKCSDHFGISPLTIINLLYYSHYYFNFIDKHAENESVYRIVRDVIRALVWVVCLWDGKEVSTLFHPDRVQTDSLNPLDILRVDKEINMKSRR